MPPCKETMEFPQESSTTPGHRKVTNGQKRNEFEGGRTSPAHVVWGPSQGDRKAPQTGPGTSRERLGCRPSWRPRLTERSPDSELLCRPFSCPCLEEAYQVDQALLPPVDEKGRWPRVGVEEEDWMPMILLLVEDKAEESPGSLYTL
ncbi:uncharacterized protein SLC30A4-AS1 isoform X2 [Homo sapiens]|uniref:uncharacterized protein SLC30A4-AS1 isoform X2 n=1 Tax=Homo sapiens TaxID=9606 RepID=UPI001FB144FE|nr:uncharacterized protein SLC30A4-AS1 isoform X2 [Homo sapiens]XP_047302508.1 uncharacterized protein SLC30A4-AS1 isoform X2 [Homo sapiens]